MVWMLFVVGQSKKIPVRHHPFFRKSHHFSPECSAFTGEGLVKITPDAGMEGCISGAER
jgi:hypothetical protein